MSDVSLWIFGYGSLVWRPAFDHVDRHAGWIEGFSRRFWQGSPDHRGVPHAPGRVVTLVDAPGARCFGVAYHVEAEARDAVLSALDTRESGGFERVRVDFHFHAGERPPQPALTYVAREGNPNFLGPAPIGEIAAQVRSARGRSGSNSEYVLQLASSLRELEVEDPHVFAVADRLEER